MYDLLKLMLSKKGSDLFITAGFPPAIKVDGKTITYNFTELKKRIIDKLSES